MKPITKRIRRTMLASAIALSYAASASALLLLLSVPVSALDRPLIVPSGDGQITQPVLPFPDPTAPDRMFYGQQTPNGKLTLTASNGFFDSGIRAGGQSSDKDAAGVEFIGPDFEYLDQWNKPLTTPFGYFGTSFKADGTSSGTANFSLWSFSTGKPKPQEQWSHMLVAGSSEAEFGSFGHEGSGVKLRGDWQPFGNDTREVTLALRGEISGPWVHWFGYFLDPKTERFRLYAAAATWNGNKPMRSLNPGAFVEQPGPPDRERSGDLVRDIQRRGWMLDEEKKWHAIDTMDAGKGLAAKQWGKTDEGWLSMGMGGMVYQEGSGKPITLDPAAQTKPDWLHGAQALKDLFKLPAAIGSRKITDITRTSAKVVVPLSGLDLAAGEKATLTVFYGPEDCLTFDRELGYREVKTRFWHHRSTPISATDGDNIIELSDLAPGTNHYLRIQIGSPRGRIWSFETDHFLTPP